MVDAVRGVQGGCGHEQVEFFVAGVEAAVLEAIGSSDAYPSLFAYALFAGRHGLFFH